AAVASDEAGRRDMKHVATKALLGYPFFSESRDDLSTAPSQRFMRLTPGGWGDGGRRSGDRRAPAPRAFRADRDPHRHGRHHGRGDRLGRSEERRVGKEGGWEV